MKLTKLLVLGALLLMGGKAMAALDGNGKRIAPEPASTAFTTGSEEEAYYLYNTSSKLFFTQGNTWGTRGCVGPASSAIKIYFGENDGASYVLNSYVCIRSTSYSWKASCADDGNAVYTDQSTGWGKPYWEVVPQEGNVFRLHNTQIAADQFMGRDDAVAQDFGNAYSGFTDDKLRFPVSANLEEGEGHHIDWVLVSVADYDAVAGALAAFEAAEALYTIIEEAEALGGVDVSTAKSLYANEAATVEELNEAATALKEAIEQRKKEIAEGAMGSATGANPVDASSLIVNPDFEGGDLKTGWSGDAFGAYNGKDNAEHYEKTYNTYQDVNVPMAGLYLVGVNAFYRAGNSSDAFNNFAAGNDESKYARLYASFGDNTQEVAIVSPYAGAPTQATGKGSESNAGGYYIPNNMEAAEYYMHTLGLYKNILPMEVDAAGVLRIGVKKETTISTDWSIFDDFSLVFCGNGADKYVGYAKMYADAAPSFDGAIATQQYIDAYNALKSNPTATDKASAEEYIASLDAAKAELLENIRLWKVYEDSVAYALNFVQEYVNSGQTGVAVQILYNYVTNATWNASAVSKINAREMTNEELLAEIANLKKMIKDVIEGVELPEGSDVTNRLANPDFSSNDWTGWTHEAASGGNVRVAEKCCEAWNNAKFDIYQEVADMPVGVYEISVQGFYRYGRGNAWNDYRSGNAPKNSPTYIYLNANTTSFMNVFAEPTQITDESFYKDPDTDYTGYDSDEGTFYFPNGMSSSARAFDHDMYVNSAFGAVTNAGDLMRIGVKGSSNQLGDSWVIFDNFKLTFWGKQADKVEAALQAALLEIEGLMNGRMGKSALAAIQTAYAEAQDALANHTSDGDYMFAKLAALYDAKNGINESVALMNELAEKIAELRDACIGLDADAVVADIRNWCDQLDERLFNKDVDDPEVETLEAQIEEYLKTVKKFEELKDALTELNDLAASPEAEQASPQWVLDAEKMNNEISEAFENGTLKAEQVDDLLKQITEMISKMFAPDSWTGTDAEPQDVTQMIRSAKFSKMEQGIEVNSFDGWKGGEGYNFGNDDTQKSALALEFWHKAFDLYQEFYGLPAGVYEVRANAFARKDNADATPTYLYANTNLKAEETVNNSVILKDIYDGATANPPMQLVTDEETGNLEEQPLGGKWTKDDVDVTDDAGNPLYIPNDMVSSVAYFGIESKPYQNSVFVKVAEDGTLRLGIKTADANTWVIMDDFELIYYGASSAHEASGDADPTGIEQVKADNAAAQVLRTEFFTINGVRTMTPQQGIVIVRQMLSNGNVVVKKMNLK